ncbi:MAG: hypothetical protein K2I66_06225, partial [Bacteroidales bacterium]|nr:hypothetical protein [Bacteroidales bacterium]
PEMGVLANGIDDEPHALQWLREHPDPFYYTFCQATKEDSFALSHLKTHFPLFYHLSVVVGRAMRLRIKRETFWYKINW